jgi:RHH-type transcriptional regulator, proline utilization regulon repressor / proline dehydrogenase / delta 1-pyrroline-5-carboxylate dehydrogenase
MSEPFPSMNDDLTINEKYSPHSLSSKNSVPSKKNPAQDSYVSMNGTNQQYHQNGYDSTETDPFEKKIQSFGEEIFQSMLRTAPPLFQKAYWSSKIMEWSMQKKDLKRNLFRLVDVMPSLTSNESIIDHTLCYLEDDARELHRIVEWGLKATHNSVKGLMLTTVVKKAVKEMASQYIAGENPVKAVSELKKIRKNGLAFTVDLLGEFCTSEHEAESYLQRYSDCLKDINIPALGAAASRQLFEGHAGEISPICISVKLTALYSQCYSLNFDKAVDVLSERLAIIVRKAKEAKATVYVDAEDSASNEIILETFFKVFGSKEFADLPLPGIAVQAYLKSSKETVEKLIHFARRQNKRIAIRLVKGAYWDQETTISEQNHWESPCFAVKSSSDANYESITKLLFDNIEHIYPAFASHNVRSLSHACIDAQEKGIGKNQFELQMLYGMADTVAESFKRQEYLVRLYVPIGPMLPGIGYLVRRLLENTSNESFLKHTFFDKSNVHELLKAPRVAG